MTRTDHDDVEGLLESERTISHNAYHFLITAERVESQMPLRIQAGAPTLIVRREPYERAGLVRARIDQLTGSTPDEFRVEGDLVIIGPVYDAAAFDDLIAQCEKAGLEYYEDFFELTGNWPEWLSILATASTSPGRSNPSQPQR